MKTVLVILGVRMEGWLQNNPSGIYWFVKKNVKSVKNEKKLLILTEVMLIKAWMEKEVNNGGPVNVSW